MEVIEGLRGSFNQCDYPNNKAYLTFGFPCGFSTSEYEDEEKKETFSINPAAALLLMDTKKDYLESNDQKKSTVQINAGFSSMSIVSNTLLFDDDLKNIKETLFFHVPSADEFDVMKDTFIKRYKKKYASPSFRKWIRVSEFTHFNKRFNLDDFHKSILNMVYEDVLKVQEKLFTVANSFLFLNGNIDNLQGGVNFKSLVELSKKDPVYYPYCQPRGSKEKIGKKLIINDQFDAESYAIHVNTFNKSFSKQQLFLYFQIIGNLMGETPDSLEMDTIEGSFIWNRKVNSPLNNVNSSEENITENVAKLKRSFISLVVNAPMNFNQWAMQYMVNGIDLFEYYFQLDNFTSEQFAAISKSLSKDIKAFELTFQKREEKSYV